MTAYAPTSVQLCEFPQELATSPNRLHANVEFGVLQSNGNCSNIGICRINTTHVAKMVENRRKNRRCPLAAATLSVSTAGRLQIFFPRTGMKACTQRVFFRAPVFPVPVAYLLPQSIQQQLPGLQQSIIDAGLYPIRRSETGYFIEF